MLVFGFAGFVVLLIACLVSRCGCCCFDDALRLVLLEWFLECWILWIGMCLWVGDWVSMPSGLDMVMNLWLVWFDLV